ncbi:hypothetical protein F4604DRAFT_1672499 [Suillus subluteus]|nr:hypothetical protein F4604DRAFT_1672499 [Suillus subluteus]
MEDKLSLKAHIVTLTKNSHKLEGKVASLEGELRSAFELYQQLLERLDPGSSKLHDSTLHDSVVALIMSIDPYPLFDEQTIDRPQKLFYRKVDWTNEKKKNHGVLEALDVDDNSGPGPCHYLVQRDGGVVSGEDQETMRNEARTAWTTMKIYRHCGTMWSKTNTFGQTFFYRHMHAHFSEFRYCAHDWKGCQFATTYFPAWGGKSEEVPGIKTEFVKVESALDIKMESGSMAPLQRMSSAKSKRPPSLTIFTSDQPTSTDSNADIASIEHPSSLTIVEPEDNYGSIINARIDGTVESNASPTDSNTTHSVPEVAPTSPLSSVSFHSLLENLASSLKTPITGPIIPAFTNVTLADIPTTQPVGLGMQPPAASMLPLIGNPKKKRESNPNAALHPTKSNTARNLCAIAYKEQNKGRVVTVGEFAAYWDNLSEEMRKPFVDQVKQIKWVYLHRLLLSQH